ncbi:MAG: helix-turn-helix transcriptional regulator [Candidatus Devosia phytovorans]|uniref:Helix-turn-helix transcriptional regulator n=1 Tax=Candidatus Devosia phytovorans TaxID=3121372 RepID=A0AAJ6AZ80_9HYPH|nr:helix-turn-helix transcriptional regulator [Devosia sp.]WEK03516.1 MAG: helix-turn-helix transcriptional regulator [Devosia sp.]
MVDKAWFETRMLEKGLSLRMVAHQLDVDPSALSRSLNAKRKLKPGEITRLAAILGASPASILEHVDIAANKGFGEMPQTKLGTPMPVDAGSKPSPSGAKVQHPAFGALKGMITLLPDVDYTEPADPEWGKVYED